MNSRKATFNLHISFSPNYTSAKICQKLHPDVACDTSRRRARDVGTQQKLRPDVIQSTSGGIGKGMYDVSQQNHETERNPFKKSYKSPFILPKNHDFITFCNFYELKIY